MSSIPPQTIRVKRKRIDETPVTFLQLDAEGAKRHRTGNNWVYQRRDGKPLPPSPASAVPRDAPVQPVIHVSGAPNDAQQTPQQSPVPRKTLTPRASLRKLNDAPEPQQRRFHLSRSVAGVSKRRAAVFVERAQRRSKRDAAAPAQPTAAPAVQTEERKLKKPSTRARHTHTPTPTEPAAAAAQDGSAGASKLPPALPPTPENMDRIAADMNQWVLSEIGANLQSIEDDKARERKLRPRAPAKRFHERHPEVAADAQGQDQDQDMADDMEDDDDEGDDSDWVIEEYVRVPAASVDISPGDVGVLVLEGAEDDMLFFGPEHDDDDEFEDDEDENAENHYTADYPEDEVDSDDEFDRHAYYYRAGVASDDEEFDNDAFDSDDDDMAFDHDGDGADDDVAMARIKNYMQRHKSRMH